MMRSVNLARQIGLHKAAFDRTLALKQRDLAQLQEQLSTGLQINRASDDATGFAQARRLEILSHRYERYQESITAARTFVDLTQENLNTMADLFTSAYEDGLAGANDTLSQDDRDALATALESLMEEVVDVLNARAGEEYLFAGTNTTRAPFARDASGTSDGAGVTYYGNTGTRTRAIGPGSTLDVNIDGQALFDTGSGFTITESLQSLIDALRAGDATQITTALDDVVTARDHVLDMASTAGTIANRLDTADAQLGSAVIRIEEQRSRVEDTDLAVTLVELQRVNTGLQATLQTMASIQQNSLLNYLN